LTGVIAFSSGPRDNDSLADIFTIRADGTNRQRLTRLPGPQFDPSWSPDGKHVVFRESRRGINENDEIYVMDADGSHQKNISRNDVNDWSPAWAPNEKWIAYSSEAGALDIWRMRPDGHDKTRLTTRGRDEYPTWSPDSTRIAFMRLGDIWTVQANGSDAHALRTTIEEEGWPAWSPSGDKIAYVVGYEGSRTIWVMNVDGSNAHSLTKPGHDDMGVAWSPDGAYLIFSRDGVLTVIRQDGSNLQSLGIRGSLPDWRAGGP
jgi:TolB protein